MIITATKAMILLLLLVLVCATSAIQMMYASLLSPAASSVSLHWNISDISVAKKNKLLLQDVYGSASRGKLHAILGEKL